MTARNKDFCVVVHTIAIGPVDYVLVADDHTNWWTTRESYDQAIAAMGDLRSDGDEYGEFCDMMVWPPVDVVAALQDKYREIEPHS